MAPIAGSGNPIQLSATLEYCSVACNTTPGCLCWSYPSVDPKTGDIKAPRASRQAKDAGTVFFGACNSIVEFDFEAADGRGETKRILSGHKGKVTCVRCAQDNTILSCSRDGSWILWRDGAMLCHVECTSGALMHGDVADWRSAHWIVTAGADDTVRLWKVNSSATESKPQEVHVLRHGRHSPLCVRLHAGPVKDTLMVFVGWTSCELQILQVVDEEENKTQSLQQVCMLSGHEDWIRGVDVRSLRKRLSASEAPTHDGEELLVASCGQDELIRVWRLGPFRRMGDVDMQVRQIEFYLNGVHLQAELETVLEGHSGWVYSVNWKPGDDLQLLSSSIDKSMVVWAPSEDEGLWVERLRVGGVGGNNLGFMGAVWDPSAGGNRILGHGFHGSLHLWTKSLTNDEWKPGVVPGGHFGPVTGIAWSPRGSYLLSCSTDQTTRLHARWRKKSYAAGQHPAGLSSLSSSTEHQVAETTQSDTADVDAATGAAVDHRQNSAVWRELARPQVHGHDLFCIAALSETSFVSGAEEKVLRAFNATRNFANNFIRITGEKLLDEAETALLPEGASVAALGLSNKALYEADLKESLESTSCQGGQSKDYNQEDFYFRPIELTAPPHEETLAQNTLWHEVRKLYGHGYELFACAASSDGSLVASACKAQSAKHAAVLVWDTASWKVVQRLEYHQLTVTCIAFSDDDRCILTVSRDRTWALWQKSPPNEEKRDDANSGIFILGACIDKTCRVHQRIIWGCAFAPTRAVSNCEGVGMFATCSRDKKVALWSNHATTSHQHDDGASEHHRLQQSESGLKPTSGWIAKLVIDVDDSARTVAFSPATPNDGRGDVQRLLLAIGLDSGCIEIKQLHCYMASGEIEVIASLCLPGHGMVVNGLCFQPRVSSAPSEDGEVLHGRKTRQLDELLASGSDDHAVRFYRVENKCA